MPKVLGIIPARINSKRIREKMVADIAGKPLIAWTIERSKMAKTLDALVVATDSDEIEKAAKAEGTAVIRWPLPLQSKNGTEGVALALEQFTDFAPDIVVNIWGDEPLYPAEAIDECVEALIKDESVQLVGIADKLASEEMWRATSVVKVLTDLKDNVLAFSRAPVPHPHNASYRPDHYHITGALAMRTDFLKTFVTLPQGPLELAEGVEQWRVLEHGYRMKVIKGEYENLGVNEPHELEEVRRIIASRIATDRRYL